MPMSHAEWCAKYSRMRDIAERIDQMRRDRARQACADAGLDPGLLGIHPHNAMCAFNAGKPWTGVNYSKVRLCLRILNSQFDAFRIVDRWDRRVRIDA